MVKYGCAPVAQWIRASVFGTEGRRFESYPVYHLCSERKAWMKLRNFLYLDTKIIEDYISAIDGFIYDEESYELESSNGNVIAGRGAIGVVSGKGSHTGKQVEGVKRSVRISDAAKFDKFYKFLQSDEDEEMKYYESLSESDYDGLSRNGFLEALVTARFSKMKELTDGVKKIAELATALETITGQQMLDKGASKAINGFAALDRMRAGKKILCVFEFEGGSYPLIAYLDESYFRCGQDCFVGQVYLLCKVIKRIPKGRNVKLDEIFDDIKQLPLNRAQRRNMPKSMDNPTELRDVIKGPALVVLPIAIYQ